MAAREVNEPNRSVRSEPAAPSLRAAQTQSVGDVVQLVKDYAKQEAVGPVRGAAQWLQWGALGAVLFGLGGAFLVLGVLRMLQTEFHRSFRGPWTQLIPYALAALVAVALIGLAVTRIGKQSLSRHPSTDTSPKEKR